LSPEYFTFIDINNPHVRDTPPTQISDEMAPNRPGSSLSVSLPIRSKQQLPLKPLKSTKQSTGILKRSIWKTYVAPCRPNSNNQRSSQNITITKNMPTWRLSKRFLEIYYSKSSVLRAELSPCDRENIHVEIQDDQFPEEIELRGPMDDVARWALAHLILNNHRERLRNHM
jgi:hypothetical protein